MDVDSAGASMASGAFWFDGLIADAHRLPARALGFALIGLDKIVASFIGLIETGKVQRQKPKKAHLILIVGEPREGSFELGWLTQIVAGLLPLVPDFMEAAKSKLVEHCVNYVFLSLGGRKREADELMEQMLDLLGKLTERENEDRQREREDRQRERENMRMMLSDQAEHLRAAAKQAVTPIGRSASQFRAGQLGADTPIIDEATADAIRQDEPVEVSDLMDLVVNVEGHRDLKRQLYVFDPEDPTGRRTLPVHIVDPFLPADGGVYREAYTKRSKIKLTGKSTRGANGLLKSFHAIAGELIDP